MCRTDPLSTIHHNFHLRDTAQIRSSPNIKVRGGLTHRVKGALYKLRLNVEYAKLCLFIIHDAGTQTARTENVGR